MAWIAQNVAIESGDGDEIGDEDMRDDCGSEEIKRDFNAALEDFFKSPWRIF